MNEPEINKKGMLRHGIFMFVMTQLANIANMMFQFIAGRKLSDAEYGVLAAMLSIYLVASTPIDALRTAMAHFATRAMRTGDTGKIRWLVRDWSMRLGWLTVVLLMVGYFGQNFAADFFHLESGLPFFITCGLIAGTFYLLLFAGVFQGIQNFYWMSASMHLWILFRVAFVYLFVIYAPTALAGLTAHGLASVIGVFISIYGIRILTNSEPHEKPPTGIGVYFVRSIIMLGSYAVLMNADLIFVKHYFAPEEAGVFAKAAIIGRSIIFLPMPIALVMFPKVITSGPSTRESRLTLLKSLLMSGLLVGVALTVTLSAPWLPLLLMYGIHEPDSVMIELLIWIVCAMAPLAIIYVLMNYEMAQHRFGLAPVLMLCGLLYVLGVMIWNDSMKHVVYVLAAVNILSLMSFVMAIAWRLFRQHAMRRSVS